MSDTVSDTCITSRHTCDSGMKFRTKVVNVRDPGTVQRIQGTRSQRDGHLTSLAVLNGVPHRPYLIVCISGLLFEHLLWTL